MTLNSAGRIACLAAILAIPAAAQTLSPEQSATPNDAFVAAQNSLGIYNQLHPTAKTESKQEVSLGTPIRDYFIRLDEFKEWNGGDVTKLLHSSGEVIFPIQSNGVTTSEVTVANRDGQWKLASFGPANEARGRMEYFNAVKSQAEHGKSADVFQVTIPALDLTFLATGGDDVRFTPIRSSASLGLKAGDSEPAKAILIRLQPAARKINIEAPG